jgi:hypothetical protein
MNVNQIRDRIVELCRGGDGPDADLQTRAMGWLNSAYHELMDELIPYLPQALQVQEQVSSNAGGMANVSGEVYRLMQVVDRDQPRVLDLVTSADVLMLDPAGVASGKPVRAYAYGDTVTIHPASAANLTVRYVPLPVDLMADGSEGSILLPKPWHHVLVWGGLVWAALFERGFGGASEIVLYQQQWQTGKANIKVALRGNLGDSLRVAAVRDL